jgi:hypothetical protein
MARRRQRLSRLLRHRAVEAFWLGMSMDNEDAHRALCSGIEECRLI